MMKILYATFKLVLIFSLVPFAWDWRSPFLAAIRPWALMGLVTVPLGVILAEILSLRTFRSEQRALRVLSTAGLITAVLVLTTTLALEARFHWMRLEVLQADPVQLEKLGRHLIVGYSDLEEARELVRLKAIAGVFISFRNVRGKSIHEVRKEIQSLQELRREQGFPPLWVATDQEGGAVSRLSPPLTRIPRLAEIVEGCPDVVQCEHMVRKFAGRQGRELANLGVNLNFAPVVDLQHELTNVKDRFTCIPQRAISSDPGVVTQVAGWYCAALEEAGVRCTLKHFPGLGRVTEDTHLARATLGTSIAELTDTDWVPFRELMRRGKAFTMLSHVRLTAIDSERPASISYTLVTGLLRGEWKHDGVIITDDFSMHALYRSNTGIDDGSVDALNAGVDLILVSWDSDQYYRVMYALLKAERQGKLNPEVLRKSDQRLARAIPSVSQ